MTSATVRAGDVRLVTVDWDDPRAVALRAAMDAEVGPRYADRRRPREAARYESVPGTQVDPAELVATLLALDAGGEAVGHAALRRLDGELEVKRVFVVPSARGTGVAVQIMLALEDVARQWGAARVVLQTGTRQPEAVGLYTKLGYRPIPVYPPYTALPPSLCFAKSLSGAASEESTTHGSPRAGDIEDRQEKVS
ncbi:N-acetyltransferase [Luteimicrobium album]|uniref:N-acetyltransferase n=1 Tax=Luteimicrobium album TaxID=1054550 RepID=A0ABQ6I116_9MICO|nr:GNAT family N-acetyltransferase [Luteimicrobium album]GMA24445.1 N-acetyltransferase [Luteimicrobium album]